MFTVAHDKRVSFNIQVLSMGAIGKAVIRRKLVLGHPAEENCHVLRVWQRFWIQQHSYSRATMFEKVARGERKITTESKEKGTA